MSSSNSSKSNATSTTRSTPRSTTQPTGLGTFGGVFTPSILTILGVIMYLRFGWVVGQVGLVKTLIIVTLSTGITLLTALSISMLATSQRVRTGGAYFMIARSLGIEAGGAVGIPLFFAQALSVALYTIGFAESVVATFPMLDAQLIGLITAVLVTALALASAETAIKTQYFIMGAIILSLISFFFGSPIATTETAINPDFIPREGFWVVFAVFFPAVTGIMAGVNMSGDLRHPRKAIPVGTLAAVIVGYIIYMVIPIFLVTRADAATLISDSLVMQRIAIWGPAIILGVWGATLSSALGSILGAPRVLQALARDGVLPNWLRWLGRGSKKNDEPRVGTLVTLAITLIAIYFGDLNAIAPVLSMFFLTTYLVLNIVALIERSLHSPSFRPSFRIHWIWPLLGFIGCLCVMFLINSIATLIALGIVLLISIWLYRRNLATSWNDVRQGLWMALATMSLKRLRNDADPKNWRPNLLVLSGAPKQRWHLIDLANNISQQSLVSIAAVVKSKELSKKHQNALQRSMQDYLDKHKVSAFLKIIYAETFYRGAKRLVDAYGLGPLTPNTILLGSSKEEEKFGDYAGMLEHFYERKRNILILNHNPEKGFGNKKRIDVWWGGLKANGGLMITVAYLIANSADWQGCKLNIKMVVATEKAAEGAKKNLEAIVKNLRMEAKAEVIAADGKAFKDILLEKSKDADLVLMGMKHPTLASTDLHKTTNGSEEKKEESYDVYYRNFLQLSEGLSSKLFVLAAEDIAFEDVLAVKD